MRCGEWEALSGRIRGVEMVGVAYLLHTYLHLFFLSRVVR
jgi:hypothetical protein